MSEIIKYLDNNPKNKVLRKVLRFALTRQNTGPNLTDIIRILGDDVCYKRILNFMIEYDLMEELP